MCGQKKCSCNVSKVLATPKCPVRPPSCAYLTRDCLKDPWGTQSDTNPKMTKETTRKIQKGHSYQSTKLRFTKHQDNISRRRSHEPEHLKFFLLVFLSE